MTDVAEVEAHRLTPTRAPLPVLATLAVGLVAGAALGVVARAWMRLISEDPEFSWSGTIFIVIGFTAFGFGQSIVALTRSRVQRRWKVTIARIVGVITMLPLFVAAGAIMLPTVVGGGLAAARTEWHTAIRVVCCILAAAPVVFVGLGLVDSFGWSVQTMLGFLSMVAIYATIIWATRFTMVAQRDGWRMSRRAKVVTFVVALTFAALPALSSVGLG